LASALRHSEQGHRLDLEAGISTAESAAAGAVESAALAAITLRLAERPHTRKSWMRRYALLLICADSAAGLIATYVAYMVRPAVGAGEVQSGYLGDRVSYIQLAILSLGAWLVTLAISGAYRGKHVTADDRSYRVPVLSAVRLVALVAICSYAFHADLSRMMVAAYFATLAASVVVGRGVVHLILGHARRLGRAQARVMIVGPRRSVHDFTDHLLARPDHCCDVVAVCATGTACELTVRGRSFPVMGGPDQVIEAAQAVGADAVVVANPAGFAHLSLQQIAWEFERSGIDLLVAPDTVSLAGPRLQVSTLRGLPVMQINHPRHESMIRSVHFCVSRLLGAALVLTALPVLVGVALAVKLGSQGPVFYRQTRIGYKGREFEMLKFRSMVPDAEDLLPRLIDFNEHDGAFFKIQDDPRVTKVGRILRKYSLDELPQLLNVVQGDMALVGPRPCLAREMTRFGEAEYRRFMVRPGMTGLWQVSGGSRLPWSDAVKTDLYYVDHWSPTLDLSILARTVRVVLAGTGC
jgi:exopolysaccharide biosynthesis polyprenyl glycosylphosphotransferase